MIKGDLHFHSLHSECQAHKPGRAVDFNSMCGSGAAYEMIAVAKRFKRRGFEYMAVTNHATDPVSDWVANGEEINRLLSHINTIRDLNEKHKCAIEVLAGVETNIIDSNGKLCVPDETLKGLWPVIASNHRPTKRLSRGEIMGGFMGAIKNKNVNIIGHITRFVKNLKPEDWEKLINVAASEGKIIEYNLRAAMPDSALALVKKSGVLVSIGSDTHPEVIEDEHETVNDYVREYYKYALCAVKYLGERGIGSERVVNTFGVKSLKRII